MHSSARLFRVYSVVLTLWQTMPFRWRLALGLVETIIHRALGGLLSPFGLHALLEGSLRIKMLRCARGGRCLWERKKSSAAFLEI
jgi:hypothetical protein